MISSKEQEIFDSKDNLKNNENELNKEVEITSKLDEKIDDRDERIALLELELSNVQQNLRDDCLRLKAEMENIRRRSEQDIEKAHKFALERFFCELLPVIDNLERALEVLDKSNNTLTSTIEGIELTLKSLLNIVRKFGLDIVDEINVSFNPEIHQAMSMLESDKYEPNKVIKIIQKGYRLHGRLIRPAMVAVSKIKN